MGLFNVRNNTNRPNLFELQTKIGSKIVENKYTEMNRRISEKTHINKVIKQ